MIKRTIECDVCGTSSTEETANSGFTDWGQLNGICLNGSENPNLCPEHLSDVANFVDELVDAYGLDNA